MTNEQVINNFKKNVVYNKMGWANVNQEWRHNKFMCKALNNVTGKYYNWTLEDLIIERGLVDLPNNI